MFTAEVFLHRTENVAHLIKSTLTPLPAVPSITSTWITVNLAELSVTAWQSCDDEIGLKIFTKKKKKKRFLAFSCCSSLDYGSEVRKSEAVKV